MKIRFLSFMVSQATENLLVSFIFRLNFFIYLVEDVEEKVRKVKVMMRETKST